MKPTLLTIIATIAGGCGPTQLRPVNNGPTGQFYPLSFDEPGVGSGKGVACNYNDVTIGQLQLQEDGTGERYDSIHILVRDHSTDIHTTIAITDMMDAARGYPSLGDTISTEDQQGVLNATYNATDPTLNLGEQLLFQEAFAYGRLAGKAITSCRQNQLDVDSFRQLEKWAVEFATQSRLDYEQQKPRAKPGVEI